MALRLKRRRSQNLKNSRMSRMIQIQSLRIMISAMTI
jgi:hypothetical protein